MRWAIHSLVAILFWIIVLAPQSQAQCLCPASQSLDDLCISEETDSCINYTIKYFEDERMEIFWDVREKFPDMNVTMFYKFDGEEWKQCPQYTLHEGYNSVCILHSEGDTILISIRDTNGTKELYFSEQEKFMFFQPNPPEHVSFQWADDEVTAKYNPPKFGQCLELELQYKSKFDKDWQHRKSSGWKINTQGFDPAICYSFRFRLEFICGVPSTSEWGAESFWKNATPLDSCAMDESKSDLNTVLILVMAVLLIIFILLLCVCRLQRIRKTLMPVIPDPKNIYSALFNDHNGNFQEWINTTANLLAHKILERVEEECVIEEEEGLQVVKAEVKGTKKMQF